MWLSSFDQADQRSVLFRRIRGGAMWTNLGTMVAGTFEARPKGGTTGEVGFKSIVYGRSVGEETIDDLKKDSFVKSSFLTNTNTCAYICSDDSGPLLWTSEAIFEDDDKASGVATKVTLKLRFKPKGCIVCPNEETGSNIPLWCLCPFVCIQMAIMIPCVYLCNASHFEAGYSQQRAMVRCVSVSSLFSSSIDRRILGRENFNHFLSRYSELTRMYITDSYYRQENHSNTNEYSNTDTTKS